MKKVPKRNEQFENIARLRAQFEGTGNPIISLDTKKKEFLGNFYREGRLYTLEELTTWDHDFNTCFNNAIHLSRLAADWILIVYAFSNTHVDQPLQEAEHGSG